MDARPCQACGGGDDEGLVLLCDQCNLPVHAQCVGFEGPVLGEWLCATCEIDGEGEGTEEDEDRDES